MTTSLFPTALDVISDPGPTTGTADVGFYHDIEHTNVNDAIAATQAKLGINNSPVTSTVDYIQHHHQHSGTDGSSALAALTARAVTDGTLLNLQAVSGASVFQISSASAGPASLLIPPTTGGIGNVVKLPPSGTPTADMTQWQNSAGSAMAGVTAAGGLYSSAALSLTKGVGGQAYLVTNPATGEIQVVNSAPIRGYSGAYTGVSGAGEQFHLDSAQGFLKLGGVSGQPSLVLNAWNQIRSSSLQMIGKDNADSGLTAFNLIADADGQVLTARSCIVQGNLGKTATGAYIGTDTFLGMSYPTYDGNTTYTKAAGVSVLPATAPPLTAGQFGVAGGMNVTGNVTIGGSLSVTGTFSVPSTTSTFTNMTVSGNETVGGTLSVTGNTTLSAVTTVTTLSALGTSSMGLTSFTGPSPANTPFRIGGATTVGHPTSGAWQVGDVIVDVTGHQFVCVTAGTPGTWVETGTPAGTIAMWGGTTVPAGWLAALGGNVSRTTYAALFAAIGTSWGAGDGSTTFGLPNFNNVFPLGSSTLNTRGGAATHTHTLGAGYGMLSMPFTNNGGITAYMPFNGVPGYGSGAAFTMSAMTYNVGTAASNTTRGLALGGSSDSTTYWPPYASVQFIVRY